MEHEEHEPHEGHADESYFEILSDPAHLVAELTFEGVFLIISALWFRWKLNKRDVQHGH